MNYHSSFLVIFSLPGGSVVKNLPDNIGNVSSIPGLGRYPGEGNGNLLQYFCLENSMDRKSLAGDTAEHARMKHKYRRALYSKTVSFLYIYRNFQ